MFDLAEIIEATQSVPCVFLGHTINLEVYSAGKARLTKEQRAGIIGLEEGHDDIDVLREVVPLIVKDWNMPYKGEAFPPTRENMNLCPDEFLVAVGVAIKDVWLGNPTQASESGSHSGSEQVAS
jgi:hypothetical protein